MSTLLAALLVSAAVPPTNAPTQVDMPAWESQVLGAIFGTYCGYYTDRQTPQMKALQLKSYADCKRDFDECAKTCVAEVKTKLPYQIADEAEGRRLGQALGECIDRTMNQKSVDRMKKAAPKK